MIRSALLQPRGEQRQDMTYFAQPTADLGVVAHRKVFKKYRYMVRQLPGIQFETGRAIFGHKIDHGLTSIAGFTMNVLE